MTKQEFIDRVLLIMNEASMADPMGSVFIGADTAKIDRQIEGVYVEAWRRCVRVMPHAWFMNKSFKEEAHTEDIENGIGYVELPMDYYLLNSFKMSGWKKAVKEALPSSDIVNALQANDYTRGTEVRPVCVIDMQQVGAEVKDVLWYYSLPKGQTNHVIEQAIYVPMARPLTELEPNTELILSMQAIEPLVYLAASTVFNLLEKSDIAKTLESVAMEMYPKL